MENKQTRISEKKLIKKVWKKLASFEYLNKFVKMCEDGNYPIDWDFISGNYDLPDWYINENLDKLDWQQLTYNQYWTEDRVRLFQEYIVWPSLDIPYASIDFVREFADKLSLKHRRLQRKMLEEFNKERLGDPGWYYDNN